MFDYLLVPDLSGVKTLEPGPIDKVQAMTDLTSSTHVLQEIFLNPAADGHRRTNLLVCVCVCVCVHHYPDSRRRAG